LLFFSHGKQSVVQKGIVSACHKRSSYASKTESRKKPRERIGHVDKNITKHKENTAQNQDKFSRILVRPNAGRKIENKRRQIIPSHNQSDLCKAHSLVEKKKYEYGTREPQSVYKTHQRELAYVSF
jgi:hypothetical protein